MTDAGADAVIAGIAAADNNDMLALGGDVLAVGQVGVQQALGVRTQEVYGEVDAVGVASRIVQVARIGCAAAQNHGIIAVQQLLCRNRVADVGVGDEGHAFLLHQVDAAVNVLLFQLHVRNAVHHQAADAVKALIYRDVVSAAVEQISGRQAGRAGADDGNFLVGADFRNARLDEMVLIAVFNQRQFVFLDGDRISVCAAGAGSHAQTWADAAGKFRERGGLAQTRQRMLPVAAVNHIVPLRNQVVQRTAGVHAGELHTALAERHAAVHAACALLLPMLSIEGRVKFVKVFNAYQRLDCRVFLTRII